MHAVVPSQAVQKPVQDVTESPVYTEPFTASTELQSVPDSGTDQQGQAFQEIESAPGSGTIPPVHRTLDLALRVGELLVAAGEASETAALTMRKITGAYGVYGCEATVTFAVISLSYVPGAGEAPITAERRVRRRTLDFSHLIDVHRLVREAAGGTLELDSAMHRLDQITGRRHRYPRWAITGAVGLIGASAALMVGGEPLVALTAFVATVLSEEAMRWLARHNVAEFFQLAVAASIGSLIAAALIATETSVTASAVVIGTVLALLPGRALVASVQDGIAGDFVTASARMMEVFFIIAAIIIGVGVTTWGAVQLGVGMSVSHIPEPLTVLEITPAIGALGLAVAFAVWLLVPCKDIIVAALAGIGVYLIYTVLRHNEIPALMATAAAAITVGLFCTAYARWRGNPSQIYLVPAIAPMLPGMALYEGVLKLSLDGPYDGMLTIVRALSIAFALAAGVNLGAEVVRAFQSGRRPLLRRRSAARRTGGY